MSKFYLAFVIGFLFSLTTASGQSCQSYVKYASLPYSQDFESWVSLCDNLDVPDSNWTNIPATGDFSWRRDDQGESAGSWDNELNTTYSPYLGNHWARFNIDASGSDSGNLALSKL